MISPAEQTGPAEHTLAVVVPVYHGEHTLELLLAELAKFASRRWTEERHAYRVSEVLLVHDCGPDRSDETIRRLAASYAFVRPVWLSRNFGQHAALLAGMASTTADWVVTMDEDGQHDPASIAALLDTAMATRSSLVYAHPTNTPPHGFFRNATSNAAHGLARWFGGESLGYFHSYRLVLGELARGLAAYCGESVYLDVALTWVVGRAETCPVTLREELNAASAYSPRKLASHFWRLVLTSGTRPLRLVSLFGALLGLAALGVLIWVLWEKLFGSQVDVPGWASVMAIVLVTSGGTLFSLGVIAEYLGIAVNTAMGKPLYLVVTDIEGGPLGRPPWPGGETRTYDEPTRSTDVETSEAKVSHTPPPAS